MDYPVCSIRVTQANLTSIRCLTVLLEYIELQWTPFQNIDYESSIISIFNLELDGLVPVQAHPWLRSQCLYTYV